jgi:hypothetical protein
MARAYLEVFASVLSGPRMCSASLHGLFQDRWCGAGFVVAYPAGAHELQLEIANQREDAVVLSAFFRARSRRVVLEPRGRLALTCRLPRHAGCIDFRVGSTFCPAQRGPSPDTRELGVRVLACTLLGADGAVDLAAGLDDA